MNHEPQTYVDLQDTGNAQSQLLLYAVARHADWDTGICYPRVAVLARMGKCSDKTARRHLSKLELDGFIVTEERQREDGSQGANKIVLVGYAEWIKANRDGGNVAKPRKAARYDRAPSQQNGPGQSDQGGSQQEDQGPGQNDQGGALDNLTRGPDEMTGGPGQQVTGGPGQQVTSPKENPFSEPKPEQSLSPPSPHDGSRRRRGREGEVDDLISKIWTEPRQIAIEVLIEPVARKLRIEAPDPGFALGTFADWALHFPAEVLADARKRLFDDRKLTAKISDIEAAVQAARKAVAQASALKKGPLIFKAAQPELWDHALTLLAGVNANEAERLRCGHEWVRRDHLAKYGVNV